MTSGTNMAYIKDHVATLMPGSLAKPLIHFLPPIVFFFFSFRGRDRVLYMSAWLQSAHSVMISGHVRWNTLICGNSIRRK